MSSHHIGKILAGFVLLIATLGAGSAQAQSVCVGPFLGAGGVEELCVNIRETETGASMDFRGFSPLVIQEVVGDYTVDLMVLFASDGGGMGVVLDGMVTRTSAGNGALVVTADGGLGTPLTASIRGSLTLIGDATDTSQTILGGAAGLAFGATGDQSFTSLGLVTIEKSTLGAGDFEGALAGLTITTGALPTTAPVVAARNITSFHLNNVGQTIGIPSGAAVGDPPLPGEPSGLLQIEIDGVVNHFPVSQFFCASPDTNCNGEHWHASGSAISLEGNFFIDNPNCGAGKKSKVPLVEANEIDQDTILPMDVTVGPGESLTVGAGSTLTVPGILTLTNADGATLRGRVGGHGGASIVHRVDR